ncbi:COR domain-containing protein, partial [Aliarcobacter butzleri]|uniref:leucine-rich repeat domain-containing protein n=1 Tax=Aliarcobacter butzleri TaxID=28197 RepID=UPI001EDB60F6
KEFPKELVELKNLTTLYLSGNSLKEFPKELVELKNLTTLYLSGNGLKELPKELGELKNLTTLYLSSNELKELPKELVELKNLTTLDLSGNELKELPKELIKLKNLTHLNLSNNGLKELPKELIKLIELRNLNLSNNGLKELPKELGELKNLTTLYLSGNSLKELPKELGELKNLTYLNLSGNELKEFPKELVELKNLTYLNLSGNELKEFPKELGELKNLTTLYLSGNGLKELPKELIKLIELKNLNLSNNGLKELPKELIKLIELRNLNLSNNGLKELPKELGELKNLTYLNLSDNGLKELPSSFFDKNISLGLEYDIRKKGILISGNPLICPPIEIIEKGEKSLNSYFAALKEGSEKLREVKVIFIGEGSAGKTSIINRITEKEFNNNEPKTHGIRINEKLHNNKKIYFWDFGGQDIMHSTHQFFLSKRCIYVLVLDGRKDEKPKYWLDMIKSFGQNSPIFVVLNKKENDNSFDISKKTLKNDYSSIIDFFELNCSEDNNEGTKEFNEKLLDFIDNSNNEELSLGTPIPKKWLNLKNNLVSLTDNHQKYTSFEQLCAKEGIEDTHIPIIVSLLHELGIMLHFEGDLLLESYYILNPKWVLDAAYKIINSSKVKSNKGKFVEKDILDILNYEGFEEYKLYPELNNYKYDKEETKFIFLLFKEFKLGYEIEKSMLLPDLLSNEYDDYQPLEDYIHIVYEYIFMPSSIMPQIIVALHEDIKDNIVWRQGVLLESKFFRCKAEIISDKERKNLNIKVSGLDKKEYLAYIRKIISNIHSPSFKSIEEPQLYLKIVPKKGNPKPISFKYLKQLEESGQKSFIPESTNDTLCDEYLISELLGSVRSKEEMEELIINKVFDELKSLNEKLSQKDIEDKILTFKANFGVAEINLVHLYNKINEKLMLLHTKLF